MEEVIYQNAEQEKVYGCKNCQNPIIEEGYELELCTECREKLSKRQLPFWVKVFFIFILLVVVVALTRFPTSLSAGIAFEKGLSADKATKYITASREYQKAASVYPESTLVQARLFIAYVKCGKADQADSTYRIIEGKEVSEELLSEVDSALDELNAEYSYSEELTQILNSEENEHSDVTIKKLKEYSIKNPKDVLGLEYLGGMYFNMGKYKEAEEYWVKASLINPNLAFLHLNLAAVYNETGKFDEAIKECNQIIQKNAESIDAYAAMASIELKRHDYKTALQMAEKANSIDKEDLYVMDTLAIVYHYNNMIKERDELFNILKQKNYEDIDSIKAIFEGKNNLID